MQRHFDHISENELDQVIEFIASLPDLPSVITLRGDLGAGKTTLVRKLVKALGSADRVSSPTFSLINEYHGLNGKAIYHSDWYRVKDVAELYDAGITEYFDAPGMLIIEWPEIGESLLTGMRRLDVKIDHDKNKRNYLISVTD